MICSKCNTQGIENEALGKKFHYCRTCKMEIGLEPKVKPGNKFTYSADEGLRQISFSGAPPVIPGVPAQQMQQGVTRVSTNPTAGVPSPIVVRFYLSAPPASMSTLKDRIKDAINYAINSRGLVCTKAFLGPNNFSNASSVLSGVGPLIIHGLMVNIRHAMSEAEIQVE